MKSGGSGTPGLAGVDQRKRPGARAVCTTSTHYWANRIDLRNR